MRGPYSVAHRKWTPIDYGPGSIFMGGPHNKLYMYYRIWTKDETNIRFVIEILNIRMFCCYLIQNSAAKLVPGDF